MLPANASRLQHILVCGGQASQAACCERGETSGEGFSDSCNVAWLVLKSESTAGVLQFSVEKKKIGKKLKMVMIINVHTHTHRYFLHVNYFVITVKLCRLSSVSSRKGGVLIYDLACLIAFEHVASM